MKRTLITIALIVTSMTTFAQKYNQDVSANIFNVIVNRWIDFSYEYYANEESSVGLTLQTRLVDENKHDHNRSYAVSPFFRYYVSDDENNVGLFGEVFIKLNGGYEKVESANNTLPGNDTRADEPDNSSIPISYDKYNNMALGISGGYKYRSDKGFVAIGYAGVGRNLLNSGGPNVVGRIALSIGYAF
ncbi:MAG: hypothetical protein CSA40_01155 [Flavobacteriales bacterium]|nr:MAG: hypothetical protein CSA40_01155 [Flavobacteriales bacterium]